MFRPPKTVFAIVLGLGILTFGSLTMQARDRNDKCAQRIHQAQTKLDQAVQHHGEHSKQAQKRRRELDQARESCRADRDRDRDRDHDRDRDRDRDRDKPETRYFR